MNAPAAPDDTSRSEFNLALVGVVVAVAAWGASGTIVKSIDMDALAIGMWRFAIYVTVLAAWMAARGAPLSVRAVRASMAGGVCLGLDVVFFFSAVKATNIVNATTIGALQPVVVSVVAWRLFGEHIRTRDVGAALVAIGAVVIIVIESSGTPEWNLRGDLFAVAATVMWAGYFVFSKRSKGRISSQEYTAGTALWTALICGAAGLIVGQDLSAPSGDDWLPLLALTFGAGVLGHSIMNWSLVRVPLWIGSVLTLLIPVVGALTAWVFLDESLSAVQMGAIVVVLLALGSIVTGQAEPEPVRAPQAPATT